MRGVRDSGTKGLGARRKQKSRREPAFLWSPALRVATRAKAVELLRSSGLLGTSREAALVTGGSILVDDALVDHAVDDRLSGLEGGRGIFRLAGVEGGTHFLDGSTHARALRHVVGPALHCLAGALLGRLDIGQGKLRKNCAKKRLFFR